MTMPTLCPLLMMSVAAREEDEAVVKDFYEASTDVEDEEDEVSGSGGDNQADATLHDASCRGGAKVGYMHLGRIPNCSEGPNAKPQRQTHPESVCVLVF